MTSHTCDRSLPCALCRRDVHLLAGGRSQTATRQPLPACAHLDPAEVRVPGSSRSWRRCNGGHGSTDPNAAGLVCGCSSPGVGVWRQGMECGERCPGFAPPGRAAAMAASVMGIPITLAGAGPSVPLARRHLNYHVYPVRGSVWRERVRQVAERWGLFTGRKVIAVAVDGRTDSADDVRAMLPPDAEVREFRNDPERGECVTWNWRWDRCLDGADDADAILYAHAKGVSRPEKHFHEWGERCFLALSDHWPLAQEQLRTKPVCGVFKLQHGFGWCGVPECDWHYSGTHYWVNAGAVRRVGLALAPSAGRWAVEAWPGSVFRSAEGGYIGLSPAESTPDRNSAEGWAQVREAWGRWERFGHLPKLNLGCGPFYAEGWTNIDLDPAVRADRREDVSTLPGVAPASVGEIYAGHLLEHVADVGHTLRRWREVLAPGGTLTVVVPDGERSVRHWLTGTKWPGIDLPSDAGMLAVATGYRTRGEAEADPARLHLHRRVWDRSAIELCLRACGFAGVREVANHPLMVRSVTDVGWQVGLTAVAG